MSGLRKLLAAIGVLALLGAAALWLQHRAAPAPYRYERVPGAAAAASAATANAAGMAAVPLQPMRVIATGNQQVLAEFEVATGGQGPVRMDWRAQVDDPLLQLPAPVDEVQALAGVLKRHRSAGTPVLAWWDVGRQLQLLGVSDLMFTQHLGAPLFLPARWRDARDAVLRTERDFWGPADATQSAAFERFTGALVAVEGEGTAQLRALVSGRRALLVLHLRDMLLLGQMHPKVLGVGFQDFADSGDVHRSVRGVHGWLREAGQTAYSVMKLPANVVRVIALKDDASANTLAARLLPFVGNRQDDVAGLTLVWRGGGFAVFELDAPGPAPVAAPGGSRPAATALPGASAPPPALATAGS